MGIFSSKKKSESVVLIDVTSSSIGAALAHLESGAPPVLHYTQRSNIKILEHEDNSQAMLRTLIEVANKLVTKGSPILRKETGNAHIQRILVSVGAPWQKTAVRIETLLNKKPFIFTRALLAEITQKDKDVPEGFQKSGESITATLLNGYDVPQPFGKKATRAELVILSSLVDSAVSKAIEDTLRKTYHTHALTLTAFAPAAYAVFRDVYPHEKDFLIFDISGGATDVLAVKRNMLVNVASIPQGINNLIEDAIKIGKTSIGPTPLIDPIRNAQFSSQINGFQRDWLLNLQKVLQEFTNGQALPGTLFLISEPGTQEYLKRLLDNAEMRSLWLTSEPLRIIPVVPTHFATYIKNCADAESDVQLQILGLYAAKPTN